MIRKLIVPGFLFAGLICLHNSFSQSAPNTGRMVLVTVTATAGKNMPVTTLKPEDFKVTEDNKEQKIEYFSHGDSPSAIGIILGAGALAARTDRVSESIRDAVDAFQKSGVQGSEYFVDGYGADGAEGAVMRGLSRLMRSPNPRKALLVIMDSHDNPGGNYETPSMEGAMKQPVPVYFLFLRGISDDKTFPSTWLTVFQDVTRNTAAQMLYPEPLIELKAELLKLSDEIKNQYVIGYTSPNAAQDGKWRSLKVTVNSPLKPALRYRSRHMVAKPGKS